MSKQETKHKSTALPSPSINHLRNACAKSNEAWRAEWRGQAPSGPLYDAKCGLQREVRQQIKFVLLWKRDCEYDDERPYFKPTHISVSHRNLGSLNVQPWSLIHHNSYRHGPSTSRALPNHKKKRIVVYTTRFVHQRSFVLPILLYGVEN